MRPLLVLAIVILVAVVTVAGIWWAGRRADKTKGGFLDYVRDPHGIDRIHAELSKRDAEVERLSNENPELLVAMLLDNPSRHGEPARAIVAAGQRMVPALLAALEDPRYRDGKQEGPFGAMREPLEGVIDCLQALAPPEAVPSVQPLVGDENEDIRKEVALLLGSIANDDAALLVCRLLQDHNEYVRSYAMMGILRAIDADRVSDEFRRTVFEAVIPLVSTDTISGGDYAPQCLLGLDRQRAVEVLTADNMLAVGQPNLHEVLHALRKANVPVSANVSTSILSELNANATEYPNTYIVGEALMLLAHIDPDKGRNEAENYSDHPSQQIREWAAEARAIAVGMDKPWEAAWAHFDSAGWDGLTTAQQHALAVRMLVDEVNNGGFLQYFFNSSGDYWNAALRGLDAIGARSDEALFKQALQVFGTEEPSADRRIRNQQIAKAANRLEHPFDEIESTFYEDKEDREVLLLLYMIEHASDFKQHAK